MRTPEDEAGALLRKVPIFTGLSDELLGQLARTCRRRSFREDQTLFFEGDPGHSLYLIVNGRVRIQRIDQHGKVLIVAHRGPGEHVGEMSILDGEPRSADAVTTERTDLLMLDRDAFIRCLEGSPRIALNVMASLSRRLREAMRELQKERELDALGKVSEALLELCHMHGVDHPQGRRIGIRITQSELAEQVGLTRVSVNKMLGQLRQVRAILDDGVYIVVASEEKLRQYSAVE